MFVFLLTGLLVSTTAAQSQPFLDVVGHPQYVQIETLRMHGIVQGYGYGLYRPYIPINRAEFLKMLTLAVYGQQLAGSAEACFTDFTGAPQWFWSAACTAKSFGIITGYPDGTFRGGETVNLVEALAMAERAWQMPAPYYFHEPSYWYDPYFDAVLDKGIAEYFLRNPGHLLTRGDAAWLFIALGQRLATVGESTSSFSSVSSASSVSSVSSAASVSSVYVHNVCGNGVKEGTEQCDDGNAEDGDGCSSICVIVPEPVQHSAIRLDQRALGADTVAGGSSQTVIFSFDANARWQDAILTGLKFDAVQGAFTAAVNYRLYEDQDGNGKPESLVGSGLVRDNVLSFSGLGARIFILRGKRFEIRADLVQTSGSLALGFMTSDTAYVEAVGAIDGRELVGIRTDQGGCPRADNCWIAVYTLASTPVTLTGRGNLFVTEASQPVRSHQLLAGAQSADLLRLSFRATDEDIRVRRITITGASAAVAEIQFFSPAAPAPFATAHTSGCRTPAAGTFCTAVDFTVRKDILQDVIVRVLLTSADDGAKSGDTFALTLSDASSGLDNPIEATGIASQEDLTQNDGDFSAEGEVFIGRAAAGANTPITGPTHDVAHAALKIITNAASDPDGTVVPTGTRTIGVFRFTAQDRPAAARTSRSVTLTTFSFDVTATNVLFGTGGFALVNMLSPTVAAPCSQTARTGDIRVTCSGFVAYGVNTAIPFGDYVTLGLKGTIENAQTSSVGNSTLQVSLSSINNRDASGSVIWNDGTSAFYWVDLPDAEIRSTLYRIP
ncbi:MAG: S-layer homology domain-containing protein [Candidatus Peribacteraceae bacterium]|nr:S-layer homology domain-containing protein [Candidatus Peribacteraceae bacterium]MDD5742886.1 S-layer homology domain-containing protein [Candidatus Peribacteraceae bacterium]